jgi:hypothetical protein
MIAINPTILRIGIKTTGVLKMMIPVKITVAMETVVTRAIMGKRVAGMAIVVLMIIQIIDLAAIET